MTRVAGQHARLRVKVLALRTLVALTTIVAVTVAGGLALGWSSHAFWVVELIGIGAMATLNRYALPIVDRWDRGAAGEEHVGAMIEPLMASGWRVLHDVSFGRGNVDHVLIGPGGLFTLETKSHRGRVDARAVNPAWLRQAYAQRKVVEELTGERADALLVFSRAYLQPPISRQRGVLVLPARMLLGHLDRREPKLDPPAIERIYSQLTAAIA